MVAELTMIQTRTKQCGSTDAQAFFMANPQAVQTTSQ